MNPGYLSYLALLVSMVLLGFGWQAQAIGNSSLRGAWWFLFGWIFSCAVSWRSPAGAVGGTCAYLPLLILAAAPLRKKETAVMEILSAYCYALLLGAVVCLLQLMEVSAKLWISFGSLSDVLIAVTVLTIVFTRVPVLQFAVLSIGLMVSDLFWAFAPMGTGNPVLGGKTFQNVWWMAAMAVRTGTVLLSSIRSVWNRAAQRI